MGFIGLYGGLICGILGWYFGTAKAKKKNEVDELYYYIMKKSIVISWFVTLAGIYVLMSLAMFGMEIGMLYSLAILMFLMLGSWCISVFLIKSKLTSPTFGLKGVKILTTIVVCAMLLTILIIAFIKTNEMLLIAALPPVLINILVSSWKK